MSFEVKTESGETYHFPESASKDNPIPKKGSLITSNPKAEKEKFLGILYNALDVPARVNGGVFEPVMNALLGRCKVLKCEEVEGQEDTFKITLDSAYEAVDEKSLLIKGKTFFIEKILVMKFDTKNFRILFPNAKAVFDAAPDSSEGSSTKYVKLQEEDVKNKNFNSIWGVDSYGFAEYTGVAYSIRWDGNPQNLKATNLEEVLITDNFNDALESLQALATPRTKTVKESIQEWNDRTFKKIQL